MGPPGILNCINMNLADWFMPLASFSVISVNALNAGGVPYVPMVSMLAVSSAATENRSTFTVLVPRLCRMYS